jgi:tetratricopeptide (TPR) repeat protein
LQRIDAVERSRVAALATPVKERTHVDLAFAYEAAGKPASALAEYEAALKRNPNDVAGLYGRGTMLLKLGKDDEGISSLWKILLRDRGHVGAASALGSYYAQHGNYASVISAVRPAVLIHPEEAQLHYLMGLAYEHLGHTDWATARYRLALAADPDLIDARAALLRLTGAH